MTSQTETPRARSPISVKDKFLQKSLQPQPGIELGTCRVIDECLNHYTNCVQLANVASNSINKFRVAYRPTRKIFEF